MVSLFAFENNRNFAGGPLTRSQRQRQRRLRQRERIANRNARIKLVFSFAGCLYWFLIWFYPGLSLTAK